MIHRLSAAYHKAGLAPKPSGDLSPQDVRQLLLTMFSLLCYGAVLVYGIFRFVEALW